MAVDPAVTLAGVFYITEIVIIVTTLEIILLLIISITVVQAPTSFL